MSDPAPAPPPLAVQPSGVLTALEAPIGWMKTHVMQFVNGVLHQRHDAVHPGQSPEQVWVPVPGGEWLAKVLEEVHTVFSALHVRIASLEADIAELKGQQLNANPPPAPPPTPTPPAA